MDGRPKNGKAWKESVLGRRLEKWKKAKCGRTEKKAHEKKWSLRDTIQSVKEMYG